MIIYCYKLKSAEQILTSLEAKTWKVNTLPQQIMFRVDAKAQSCPARPQPTF